MSDRSVRTNPLHLPAILRVPFHRLTAPLVFRKAGTTFEGGCVVGANSVVHGNFPAGAPVVGTPARIKRISAASQGDSNAAAAQED
jgi:hypothetical protein